MHCPLWVGLRRVAKAPPSCGLRHHLVHLCGRITVHCVELQASTTSLLRKTCIRTVLVTQRNPRRVFSSMKKGQK